MRKFYKKIQSFHVIALLRHKRWKEIYLNKDW